VDDEKLFQLGDVVRWRNQGKTDKSFSYGLVIQPESLIRHGTYSFASMLDGDDASLKLAKVPIFSLTVYSFSAQKVITLYQSPEEVPLFIEKVDFIKKNA
tara:strand:- start:7387 stop:7686 length:300 start_codon:yes stop_codon:yes gene_type:complete